MPDTEASENDRIFDLASGLDTLAIGVSPAESFAMVDALMAQALGLAMLNAVSSQQNAAILRAAAVTMSCTALLSLAAAASAARPAVSDSTNAALGEQGNDQPEGPTAEAPAAAATSQGTAAGDGVDAGSPGSSAASPIVVNPQIVEAIKLVQRAVLEPQIVLTSGAGKAYQSVAQSAAISIQDAADAWRAASIISATASAAAMARFLATGDEKYLLGVTAAQETVRVAAEDFERSGAVAAAVLRQFPSG